MCSVPSLSETTLDKKQCENHCATVATTAALVELTETSWSREDALLYKRKFGIDQSAGEPADWVPRAAWGRCLRTIAAALRVHSHEQAEAAEHIAALRPAHGVRHRGSPVWDTQHCCRPLAEVHIIDWEATYVRARALRDLCDKSDLWRRSCWRW